MPLQYLKVRCRVAPSLATDVPPRPLQSCHGYTMADAPADDLPAPPFSLGSLSSAEGELLWVPELVLGLNPTEEISAAAVRKARRQTQRDLHPDKGGGAEATERSRTVNSAADLLLDHPVAYRRWAATPAGVAQLARAAVRHPGAPFRASVEDRDGAAIHHLGQVIRGVEHLTQELRAARADQHRQARAACSATARADHLAGSLQRAEQELARAQRRLEDAAEELAAVVAASAGEHASAVREVQAAQAELAEEANARQAAVAACDAAEERAAAAEQRATAAEQRAAASEWRLAASEERAAVGEQQRAAADRQAASSAARASAAEQQLEAAVEQLAAAEERAAAGEKQRAAADRRSSSAAGRASAAEQKLEMAAQQLAAMEERAAASEERVAFFEQRTAAAEQLLAANS